MKLSLEHYDTKHTIEDKHDDLNIHETINMIYSLLLSAGFHANTVKEGFLTKAEELEGV